MKRKELTPQKGRNKLLQYFIMSVISASFSLIALIVFIILLANGIGGSLAIVGVVLFALSTVVSCIGVGLYRFWRLDTEQMLNEILIQSQNLEKGERTIYSSKTKLPIYQDIISKLNEMIHIPLVKYTNKMDDHTLYRGQTLKGEDFENIFDEEVKSNPTTRSALFYFSFRPLNQLVPTEAIQKLVKEVRETYPDSLIGVYDDHLLAYLYHIDARVSLKEKATNFIANFTYINTYVEKTTMDIFTVSLGIAIYPGVPSPRLIRRAKLASEKGEGINIDNGTLSKAPEANRQIINQNSINMAYEESIQYRMVHAGSQDERFKVTDDLLDYYLGSLMFDCGGLMFFQKETGQYRSLAERSLSPEIKGFSSLGNNIPKGMFDALVKAASLESPFFVEDIRDLPKELQACLSSIEATSIFIRPVYYNKEFFGFIYFFAKDKIPLSFEIQNKLHYVSPYLGVSLIATAYYTHERRCSVTLNSLLNKTASFTYSVDNNYRLIWFNDELPKVFPKVKEGAICYKALFNFDIPCQECPLRNGRVLRNINELSLDQSEMSLLSSTSTLEGLKTILISPKKDLATSSSLIDQNLLIPGFRSLELKLNKEFKGDGRGYILFLKVYDSAGVAQNFGSSFHSVLNNIVLRLKEAGLDNELYRYDKDSLCFFLKGVSSKNDIYDFVEEIALTLEPPYENNGRAIDIKCNYSLVSYPGGANDIISLKSIAKNELDRSMALGPGIIVEVGRKNARFAYRKDHILALMKESLDKHIVSSYVNPIAESSTLKSVSGEWKVTVYDEFHKRVHHSEFAPIAISSKIMQKMEMASLEDLCRFYKDNKNSILKSSGVKSLLFNIEYVTLTDPDFKGKVKELLSKYSIPKGFLVLSIDMANIEKNRSQISSIVKAMNELGVYSLVRSYSFSSIAPNELSEMGFKFVRFSTKNITEANDSLIFAIGRNVDILEKNKITIVASGIDDEERIRYARELGVTYLMGEEIGSHLSPSNFVISLNYKQ